MHLFLRFLFSLSLSAFFFIASSITYAKTNNSDIIDPAELSEGEIQVIAKRDLIAVTELLKTHSDSVPLLRARLRLLHALSVSDDSFQKLGEGAISELVRRLSIEEGQTLALAYRGAFHIVTAKHAFWPGTKLDEVKLGLPLLDSAVKWMPDHADFRYLRLTSCYYLPFFFKRKDSVKEDFIILAQLLPGHVSEMQPQAFLGISDFVLRNGNLPKQEFNTLKNTRQSLLNQRHQMNANSQAKDIFDLNRKNNAEKINRQNP